MATITMMATLYVRACDLNILMAKIHDIWEGNVTTRREIEIGRICSLRFHDIREGVTLRRVILRRLRCINLNHIDIWMTLLNCGSFCIVYKLK